MDAMDAFDLVIFTFEIIFGNISYNYSPGTTRCSTGKLEHKPNESLDTVKTRPVQKPSVINGHQADAIVLVHNGHRAILGNQVAVIIRVYSFRHKDRMKIYGRGCAETQNEHWREPHSWSVHTYLQLMCYMAQIKVKRTGLNVNQSYFTSTVVT